MQQTCVLLWRVGCSLCEQSPVGGLLLPSLAFHGASLRYFHLFWERRSIIRNAVETTQAHTRALIPLHLSHQIVQGRKNFCDKARPSLQGNILSNYTGQSDNWGIKLWLGNLYRCWCDTEAVYLHKHLLTAMTMEDFDLSLSGAAFANEWEHQWHITHTTWWFYTWCRAAYIITISDSIFWGHLKLSVKWIILLNV